MTLPSTLYVSGSKYQAYTPPSSYRYVGWRCLHAREGGLVNPVGMPNVRPVPDPPGAPPVPFGEALQLLSWDLMRRNTSITKEKWRVVYADTTAFTNENGFDPEGDDQRADYVNRRDLNRDDPKLMKAIVCAGMFLRADVEGDYLVCRPGIHAIDATRALPTTQQVIDLNWYFVANTGQGAEGAFNFPQGNGGPVFVIYALIEPVRYLKSWFEPWNSDVLPDPLKYYRSLI